MMGGGGGRQGGGMPSQMPGQNNPNAGKPPGGGMRGGGMNSRQLPGGLMENM